MSVKHPIISVTGSSGAGTTTVKSTFERIFTREKIQAAWIEGDAFHRYGRDDMRRAMAEAGLAGNNHFSHFGPEANLLTELEQVFAEYGRKGTGTPGTTSTMTPRQSVSEHRRGPSPNGNLFKPGATSCSTRVSTAPSLPTR